MQFERRSAGSYKVIEQNNTTQIVLAELSKELLSGNQVGNIFNNPVEFPTKLIEEFSITTALRYWNGQMTFTEADCVMNNLHIYSMSSEWIEKGYSLSGLAWECYLAFDAGEFYQAGEDRSIEPSEKYTKPLIEDLLKKQGLISS